MDRRDFLTGVAAAAAAMTTKDLVLPNEAVAQATTGPHLYWQLWSRHLQWVATAAQSAADPYGTGVLTGEACLASGYSCVDVTVRSGGSMPSMAYI